MVEITSIKFKSNIDFSSDTDVLRMTDYQYFRKEGRLVKKYIPPETIIDNINGEDVDVHKKIWEGYELQFIANESQLDVISTIETCKDVSFFDADNDINVIADMSSSQYFNVDVGDYIGETSNHVVTITFRTNTRSVNLKTATLDTYYVTANGNTYYTDIMPLDVTEDSEIDTVQKDDGIEESNFAIVKKITRFTYYLTNEEKNDLKYDFENGITLTAKGVDPGVLTGLENRVVVVEQLSDDFFRCVVDFVYYSDINYYN